MTFNISGEQGNNVLKMRGTGEQMQFWGTAGNVGNQNFRFGELPNFSNRAICIINFERLSPNFIADSMNWFLNSMLD